MRPFVLPSDGDGKVAGYMLWGGQRQRRQRERPWGTCEGRDRRGQECPHHCGDLNASIQPGGSKKDCFQRQRDMVYDLPSPA